MWPLTYNRFSFSCYWFIVMPMKRSCPCGVDKLPRMMYNTTIRGRMIEKRTKHGKKETGTSRPSKCTAGAQFHESSDDRCIVSKLPSFFTTTGWPNYSIEAALNPIFKMQPPDATTYQSSIVSLLPTNATPSDGIRTRFELHANLPNRVLTLRRQKRPLVRQMVRNQRCDSFRDPSSG